MGGTLEYLSDLLGGGGSRRRYKKRKQFQTVELKVRMDCDGCEMKVRNALSSMKGTYSAYFNFIRFHSQEIQPSVVLKAYQLMTLPDA
jgi:hypothetical protein